MRRRRWSAAGSGSMAAGPSFPQMWACPRRRPGGPIEDAAPDGAGGRRRRPALFGATVPARLRRPRGRCRRLAPGPRRARDARARRARCWPSDSACRPWCTASDRCSPCTPSWAQPIGRRRRANRTCGPTSVTTLYLDICPPSLQPGRPTAVAAAALPLRPSAGEGSGQVPAAGRGAAPRVDPTAGLLHPRHGRATQAHGELATGLAALRDLDMNARRDDRTRRRTPRSSATCRPTSSSPSSCPRRRCWPARRPAGLALRRGHDARRRSATASRRSAVPRGTDQPAERRLRRRARARASSWTPTTSPSTRSGPRSSG